MKTYQFPCGCSFPVIGGPATPGGFPLLDFCVEDVPRDCPAVYEAMSRGDTVGVFQLEKPLGQDWSRRLKPETMEHIAALGALLRPGTLNSKDEKGVSMTEHYCRRKNNEEEVDYINPALEPHLRGTYGVISYQEVFMSIAADIAGFDLAEVDRLRKGVAKKEQKIITELKDKFIGGCARVGKITDEQARLIWSFIEAAGRYSFNKCIAGYELLPRTPGSGGRWGGPPLTVAEAWAIRNDIDYARATGHSVLRRKWKRLGGYGAALSMCADGRIRHNQIRDIRPAGVRPVFRVTLRGGQSVVVTDNHKFPTESGEVAVADMGPGLRLYVRGDYEPTSKKYGFSGMTREELRARGTGTVNGARGESNWAYTNGSFTDFCHADAVLPLECGTCGKKSGRLELHHRDQNRCDSSLANVVRLCAGCHKKADYALGRTRKGEKGYPARLVEVESVEELAPTETYDVEMDGPDHNYVTGSGIVTCNSHAVEYSYVSYETMYAKVHNPAYFYAAWMSGAALSGGKTRDALAILVEDANKFGVKINPPSVLNPRPVFFTDANSVTYGIANVKGIGEKSHAAYRLVAEYAQRLAGKGLAEFSWFDYYVLCLTRVSRAVAAALVASGACDCFGLPRARMLAEHELYGQLKAADQEWLYQQVELGYSKSDGAAERERLEELLGERGRLRAENKGVEGYKPPSFLENEIKELRFRLACVADRAEGGRAHAALAAHGAPLGTMEEGLAALALVSKEPEVVRGHLAVLRNPPAPLVDSVRSIVAAEEELLGAALTAHRTDQADLGEANCSVSEFLAGRTGRLFLGVEVVLVKRTTTRSGKSPGAAMCQLSLRDRTGKVSGVCFPEDYRACGHLLREGAVVLVHGERSKKEATQLVVKNAWLPR